MMHSVNNLEIAVNCLGKGTVISSSVLVVCTCQNISSHNIKWYYDL
jgi:hypothetical protein